MHAPLCAENAGTRALSRVLRGRRYVEACAATGEGVNTMFEALFDEGLAAIAAASGGGGGGGSGSSAAGGASATAAGGGKG